MAAAVASGIGLSTGALALIGKFPPDNELLKARRGGTSKGELPGPGVTTNYGRLRVSVLGRRGVALPENLEEAWMVYLNDVEIEREAFVSEVDLSLARDNAKLRTTRCSDTWEVGSGESCPGTGQIDLRRHSGVIAILRPILRRLKKREERSSRLRSAGAAQALGRRSRNA